LIVRLHERAGRTVQTTVALGFRHGAVHSADLMENPERLVRVGRDGVRLTFRPFQIVTLLVAPPQRR
jgi:alpha-mannosidase